MTEHGTMRRGPGKQLACRRCGVAKPPAARWSKWCPDCRRLERNAQALRRYRAKRRRKQLTCRRCGAAKPRAARWSKWCPGCRRLERNAQDVRYRQAKRLGLVEERPAASRSQGQIDATRSYLVGLGVMEAAAELIAAGDGAIARPAGDRCGEPPGSPARIESYRARADRGEEIFSPADFRRE